MDMSFEMDRRGDGGSLDRTGRFTPTTAQAHASLIAEIERLRWALEGKDSTIAHLTTDLNEAQAMIATDDTELQEKDATIERVKVILDERWGQSSEVDDLIDDIHSTIAGKP